MLKEIAEYIVGLSVPNTPTFDGRQYVDKSLNPVKPPVQSDLDISTLTSIEDYFRDNPDKITLENAVVHIASCTKVSVISSVEGPWIQRHGYLTSQVNPKPFSFGRYMPIEDFMIAIQTYFVPDEVTDKLLRVVGNITDSAVVKLMDDGVTQTTEAKAGIARIENVQLPNPVNLAPYRTFLEVAQPSSAFVFRMKKSSGSEGPTAALFEADGGNWQLESIKRVRDWLRTHLPTGTVILA